MNKFVAIYTACSILVVLMAGQAAEHSPEENQTSTIRSILSYNDEISYDNEVDVEEELESEIQLKKMISYVTPLMAIFQEQRKKWSKRSVEEEYSSEPEELDPSQMVEEGRKRGRRPPSYKSAQPDRMGSNSYYGDYGSASSYGGGGYGGGCCDKKDDLLPILALTALSLLLLYLIAIATTTTTAAGRRRRRSNVDENLIQEDQQIQIGIWNHISTPVVRLL